VKIDRTNSRVILGNHGAVSRVVRVTKTNGVPVIERPTDDGTVALYPVGDDGSLGTVSDVAVFAEPPAPGSQGIRPETIGPTALVQIGPACHDVAFDRTQRWIIATDNGYDHIYIYPFTPGSKTLQGKAYPAPPGKAPRHIAVHPRAPYFYITNEREPSVSSYHLDPGAGEVTLVQTIATVPEADAAGGTRISPADIRIHPTGKFLYSSNRIAGGHDSLALFAVDADTGRLSRVDVLEIGGSGHREFNIEPSGRFLFSCNTQSNDVTSFALDTETGKMRRTAKTTVQRAAVIDFAML
jgi:6-phosphogluconolactonase